MERTAEKNDVDVSALFKWNKKLIISDVMEGKNVSVYIRLVGDADLGLARAFGYREAGKIRKQLKTEGSDERSAMIANLEDFLDKSLIVKAIILLRINDYYQLALKSVEVKEPKEPESDDQEAWELYQKDVDEFPEKYAIELNLQVENLRSADEKILSKKSDKELYAIYETEVINRLSQEKMAKAFSDMCIYLSVYTDEKFTKRAFKSFEEFNNIHPTLKERLEDAYRDLELGTDFLKKLPGVTV